MRFIHSLIVPFTVIALFVSCVSQGAKTTVSLSEVIVTNVTGISADMSFRASIVPGKEGIPSDMAFFLLVSEPNHTPVDTSDWNKFKLVTPDTTQFEYSARLNELQPRSSYHVAILCRCGNEQLITPSTQFRTKQVLHAVNLGLPSGLKWASENITDTYGKTQYYSWGETSEKRSYQWETYRFGNYNELTKYCTSSSSALNGNFDNKAILDLDDDVAHIKFGGRWRIPSMSDWKELVVNCKWEWTKSNDQNGFKVTGPNGKSIFLPADGQKDRKESYQVGQKGFYWSSNLYTKSSELAWCLVFDSSGAKYSSNDSWFWGYSWEWDFSNTGRRCLGRAIRAVRP